MATWLCPKTQLYLIIAASWRQPDVARITHSLKWNLVSVSSSASSKDHTWHKVGSYSLSPYLARDLVNVMSSGYNVSPWRAKRISFSLKPAVRHD